MDSNTKSPSFESCPRCGEALQDGFAHKAAGLSFLTPESLERSVSLDEDLAGAGLSKLLPSVAAYFRSQVCRSCELYLVDFSQTYDREQAKGLIEGEAVRNES